MNVLCRVFSRSLTLNNFYKHTYIICFYKGAFLNYCAALKSLYIVFNKKYSS